MYPRVRVKESEDPVSRQVAAATYMFRVIESLSLEKNRPVKFSVSEHMNKGINNSNKSYTKDSHPKSKNQHSPTASTPKEKSVKGADEENRNNLTAISIPRPRAVLSSPDNDDIIGNQNKRVQERRRSVKGQASDNNGITTNRTKSVTRKRTESSTQCSHIKTKSNNLHSDQRAGRQPFNLNTRIQPNANNNDLKQPQMYRNTPPRANHIDVRLQSPANNQKSVLSANNGYPKIKCSGS